MTTIVTKKQIAEKTTTNKGQGWKPEYGFRTNINNIYFEKPMGGPIYVTTYNEETGQPFTKELGYVDNKKEYIQILYDYINN